MRGREMGSKDKPCDICGDDGVFEAIVTCCECKIARQHLYCMRIFRTEVPPFWSCEECDQNKLVSPRPSFKEHLPEASTQKAPSLMQTISRTSGGQNKNAFASRFNFVEQRVHTGKTKYISCEEAVKLSSFAKQSDPPSKNAFCSAHGSSKLMPPPRERTLIKTPQQERTTKFEPQLQQPVVQKSTSLKAEKAIPSLRNRGDAAQCVKSCKRERANTEREMKTAKSEVLPPRKEVADTRMHIEVPKSSKRSETANTKAGGKNHANEEAGSCDAGKPNPTRGMPVSEMSRPYIPALHAYWKYDNSNSIMDFLWRKNLLMRSSVDGVELLVLPSTLLQPHSQEFQGNYFLWGVFRRIRHPSILKKAVQDGKVGDTRPLLEAKREPYDDCPPGFQEICRR
ncbi:uncharacterized protein LOC112510879 [Cynara cardunculus var. scolymus]|uniref:uncharacterized protein LOC112510879 n=1 Tax=Cynara cardunculus var. scolymus TaxID=59895 RepID=UPI000D627189|nr:uncharacterized protein LOC112510879 [Cynara cardunculus var. scolymus]